MNTCKLAVLFPGQGAYYKGALSSITSHYPQIRTTFAEIDEIARQEFNQSVSDVLFDFLAHSNDTSTPLPMSTLLQFALYGIDVALYKILEAHGLQPDVLLGHSFGEIAALVCGGAFTIREGAFIVAQRSKALEKVQAGNGYMAALNIDATRTAKLLELVGNPSTVIAVENHEGQTVISGPEQAMNMIGDITRCLKIAFTRINSPYPFHSPLLQPAVTDFAARIQYLKQKPLHTRVFSPIMKRHYSPDDRLTALLAQHLILPVNFTEAIRALHAQGVDTFIECGALDTLSKCTRKILKTEDVDVFASLPPLQDEAYSLDTLLKELERYGYIPAKGITTFLADIILPEVEPENFNAFWMVMGRQILTRIKQDYKIFLQKTGHSSPTSNKIHIEAMPSEPVTSPTRVLARNQSLYKTEQEPPEEYDKSVGTGHALVRKHVDGEHPRTGAFPVPTDEAAFSTDLNGIVVQSINRQTLFNEITALYAEALEYPLEVFSDDIQLEAELGIDSVKQTELLTRVSERYQLPPRPANFRMSHYDTIGKIVDFVLTMLTQNTPPTPSTSPTSVQI